MTQRQRLELQLSESRQAINEALGADTVDDEALAKLTDEHKLLEQRFQAAVLTEEPPAPPAPAEAGDNEARERAALEGRVSLGRYLAAFVEGRAVEGAELELQQADKLPADAVPFAALALPELETRAVTPGPTTLPASESFIGRVFKNTAAAWMGVQMPRVPAGQRLWHLISAGPDVEPKAKDAAADATAGSWSSVSLDPRRITGQYEFRVEDLAEHSGLEMALRSDLGGLLAEALDEQIIAGDGSGANVTGISRLSDPADDTDVLSYAAAKALAAGAVDGRYAADLPNVRLLAGAATYTKLNGLTPTNDDSSDALAWWRSMTGGVRVSAHLPAPAGHIQRAVVARTGARITSYCPIWDGVKVIRDPYSGAGEGKVTLTTTMLFNFMVVDAASYTLRDLKLAS